MPILTNSSFFFLIFSIIYIINYSDNYSEVDVLRV